MLKRSGHDADSCRVLARYRFSLGLVLVAVAATGAFFAFFRPEYRPPGGGKAIYPPSYVSPASHGWIWPHGLPGYRFGHDEDRWNFSKLRWNDLAMLRIAARDRGIDPQSLRILDGERLMPRERPFLLVAGRGPHGRTCFGAQPGNGKLTFVCTPQLKGDVAFLMAVARPYNSFTHYTLFIDGVASAAVKRATIAVRGATTTVMHGATRTVRPAGPQPIYQSHLNYSWGTILSYRSDHSRWNARLVFYGVHGKRLATLALRYTHPGAYVYCASALAARCGSSAHRRS
jgi:hypothetical protein